MSSQISAQEIARNSLRRAGYKVKSDDQTEFLANINKAYAAYDNPLEAYEREISILAPDQRANYERCGIALQPKQIAFAKASRAADNFDNPGEVSIGGARSGGKSFVAFAQVAVDDCIRFPGLKVLFLRQTLKASQQQMTDLVLNIARHIPCTPMATRIDYANGSLIVIGGFKDDKQAATYQGIQYDLIVIEELTQLREHTYKTIRLSLRTSKKWRSRNYNTFNPLGIGHMWVKKRFIDPHRMNEANGTVFIPSTVDDNAFVDIEYKSKLEDLTGAELRAFRYGDWDLASGAYFETWNYDAHTIPPFDVIPDYWRVWASIDAGFNHWNIVHFFAQDTDGNVYCFHELAHRKHHPDTIAVDIQNAMKRYGLDVNRLAPFIIGTDAFQLRAGQQSTVADQYRLYNLNIQSADMSPGSRITGWQRISRRLGDPRQGKIARVFITRNCPMLIDTLPYLERDPHNPEDVRKVDCDEDGHGGDDAADCFRYGLSIIDDGYGSDMLGSFVPATYTTFNGAY